MASIVLGVTGSIAAYRAADLARELMRDGHTVRVCLTRSASRFVTPVLFESLTGQPCLVDVFDEPVRGRMAHIDWARQADLVLIAPATANTIARIAYGIGDDMLTTIVLATGAPLVVAPAMNPHMYANPAHQAALKIVDARAAAIVDPMEGDVACGEEGKGKLATTQDIVAAVRTVLGHSQRLAGRKVLITSGPTREPVDGVRFLTNRSSGKMGAALARAALLVGAEVTVVAGPQEAALPNGATVIRVETAQQMLEAALPLAPQADLIIGAAAVADYRPESPAAGKVRRSNEPLDLRLVPNPDVIAELAKAAPNARVVGFAAEPTSDLEVARQKLERKGLFAVAANDITRSDSGFDSDTNELALVTRDGGSTCSGVRSKLGCALWLLEQVV